MTKEIGPHDCAEADKELTGMREFFILRLAVDDAGEIHGTAHYHGDSLSVEPVTPLEVALVCSTVADAVRGLLPQVLDAVYLAAELSEQLEEIINRTEENHDSKTTSNPQSDATATSGQLKQHGTVVH